MKTNNSESFNFIVIGLGGAGSSIIYYLAKAGHKVLGIERYSIPNKNWDRGLIKTDISETVFKYISINELAILTYTKSTIHKTTDKLHKKYHFCLPASNYN